MRIPTKDLWYKLTTDNDGNNPEQIKLTVTPSANADIAWHYIAALAAA
ncbi:MAG: hypothetical protein IPI42_08545 [Saprospiraceae bacterium]|nr:hypothetical protein [Candidatus Parvibacillus calidus]